MFSRSLRLNWISIIIVIIVIVRCDSVRTITSRQLHAKILKSKNVMLCNTIPLDNRFRLIGQRHKNHQPRISSFFRNTRCLGHNGLSLNTGVAQLALNEFCVSTLKKIEEWTFSFKKTLIKAKGVVTFTLFNFNISLRNESDVWRKHNWYSDWIHGICKTEIILL